MIKTDYHFTKINLQSLFNYADGNLYWKSRKGRRIAGTLAGTASNHYHQICINYTLYRTHRIIWAFHYGPSQLSIDHINGNSFDNHIENLRECTNAENQYNRKKSKNNASGVKGISWSKQKQKWRGRILFDGKEFHIGFFEKLQEAKKAIEQKRTILHGVFSRHF